MRQAAAGICLLKCFCLCFCWTFSAKPEPRIPYNHTHQKHTQRHIHTLSNGYIHVVHDGLPRSSRAAWEQDWNTAVTFGEVNQSNTFQWWGEPIRCVQSFKTYGGQSEKRDGEDGETGSDRLSNPGLWYFVPIAYGGDCHLKENTPSHTHIHTNTHIIVCPYKFSTLKAELSLSLSNSNWFWPVHTCSVLNKHFLKW